MDDSERNQDGTFAVGHVRRGGRLKGSVNRFTALRAEFVNVFNECNGREKLEKLLEDEPKAFFGFLVQIMPKLKVQEAPLDISEMELSEIPTDVMLKALGFTSIEDVTGVGAPVPEGESQADGVQVQDDPGLPASPLQDEPVHDKDGERIIPKLIRRNTGAEREPGTGG